MILVATGVRRLIVAAVSLSLYSGHVTGGESDRLAASGDRAPQTVAWISGEPIARADFQAALHRASRKTFYHGKVAPERLARLQRDVVNRMIDERLLLKEAERRGIRIQTAVIDSAVAQFEARNQHHKDWAVHREQILKQVRAQLERDERLRQLEREIRQVGTPTEEQLQAFYRDNPESFTEPERAQVSVILLKVDPSSPTQAWDAATQDATKLVARLRAGASFEAAARLQSADDSAEKGGDLGYVHRGMLAAPAEQAMDKLSARQISDPVRVLQGVLILRLNKRVPARLLTFESSRDRVEALWRRQTAGQAWNDLIASLRASHEIALNEQSLLPLSSAATGGPQSVSPQAPDAADAKSIRPGSVAGAN